MYSRLARFQGQQCCNALTPNKYLDRRSNMQIASATYVSPFTNTIHLNKYLIISHNTRYPLLTHFPLTATLQLPYSNLTATLQRPYSDLAATLQLPNSYITACVSSKKINKCTIRSILNRLRSFLSSCYHVIMPSCHQVCQVIISQATKSSFLCFQHCN